MNKDYTLCYREKCSTLSLWTCEHGYQSIDVVSQRAKQLGRHKDMVTIMIPFFKNTPIWLRGWYIKYYLTTQLDILHRGNPYDN